MPQPEDPEAITMFHYLLEMHRDSKSLMRLELNVPVDAFSAVRMAELVALEAMLLEYGQRHDYTIHG